LIPLCSFVLQDPLILEIGPDRCSKASFPHEDV
jgi:hypothetical protein